MSNPCPPGQRNDLFIISPGNADTVVDAILGGGLDVSPPCGCYEEMNISILDMFPFGLLMKKLGKFNFVAKYLTKLLKEGNAKWIRGCQLVGGKLTEVGAEGANLIKKSRDEVLAYFRSVGKKSIREMYRLGPRQNYYRTPGGKSFTNTLPDVTYTEVGAKVRGIDSSATIGSTDNVGSLYNTNTLASNIDAVLSEADAFIQSAANAFQDQETLDTLIRQFSNGSVSFPVAPGPKKITFNFVVGSRNSPYKGPKSIEIDVDSFLGSFDMLQEDLFNILPSKRSSMKSVKFDSAFNENLWDAGLGDGIVNKIQQKFPGIDVANQTDVLFSSKEHFLGTGTAPTKNKAGTLGNMFNFQARSNRDEMDFVLETMIEEDVAAAEKVIPEFQNLKNDYNYSIRKLETIVRNGKEEERLNMVKEALDDADSSVSQKVTWGGQCFYHIFGRAINGVGRQKVCLGDTFGWDNGARLNYSNCNCECPSGQQTCSADYTLNPVWGTAMWVWDNMIPVNISTAEMATCFPACCEGQVAYKSTISHSCGCECFGDLEVHQTALESGSADSHFKGGSGCDCLSEGWMGFGKARGKCVSDSATALATGQGQAWDDAKCVYNCAETRALPEKLGASPDCPTTTIIDRSGPSYSTFKPGSVCECECSQAASGESSWPPTCDTGSTFDASPNVCACRANDGFCCGTCTKADSPSDGGSCDGCTGCCIYDPGAGAAGWDGYYCLTYAVTGSPTGDDCYGCEFGGSPDSEGSCQYLADSFGCT